LVSDGVGIYTLIVSNFVNSRLERRQFSDGAISGFGGGLIPGIFYPQNLDTPQLGLVLQGSTLYVGGSTNTADREIMVEARDSSTGALVTSFGTNGVLLSNPTAEADGAISLQADASSLYIFGINGGVVTDRSWYLEKRVR
jgi:hypothetical protein